MATTTPDSLYYPVGTDQVAPLQTVMATMQSSTQTALNKRQRFSYIWASAAARTAQTGMSAGSTGYQVDTGVSYIYNGTAWINPSAPVYGNFTFVSVFISDTVRTPRVAMQGGRVYSEGSVRSTNATYLAATSYTVGSIPTAFAPKVVKSFSTDLNRVHGYVAFQTDGTVTFSSTVGFTGVLDLTIDGFNWTDKALA